MSGRDHSLPGGFSQGIRLPLLALVGGALAVAFAPIFPKMAMTVSDTGPIATAFWRLALAFPVLLVAWLILRGRTSRPTPSKPMPLFWLFLPGIIFGFDLVTWHLSFPLTTAANATLLANLEVVLVGIVGWLVLKENLQWPFALGGVLALGGVALLMWSGPPATEGRSPLMGDLLALLTAVWYASYLLSVKRIRRQWNAMTVILISTGMSAIVLFISTIVGGESFIPNEPQAWIYLILLAIIPHCLGQGLIIYALASLPASLAAVTLLLQPVGAAIWGWLLLDEALNQFQILASVIVLIGIGLARLGSGD
ncbi:MAG: DMT family transporter [Phycisphaerales bacterium]|nr:DMT family transporter [Phycisphaerales bacterium]